MVSLNKPAAGDTDWTTEINDNWTSAEGSFDQTICQGRITLSSGNPAYSPQPKTPSSTSTASDTVDFSAAHGWTTGTMVTPSATGGGLTAGTIYYINAVDSDTVSFHTTLANAIAGTPKVDLTASITAEIQPSGLQAKTIYFSPFRGDRIALYSGSTWNIRTFTEQSLALSSLTSGKNYDVFVYDNSGTPTLELSAAWTNDTTRADALTTQNGVRVKSGSSTRRYVGTLRTIATDATEDSLTKRFVVNYYSRLTRMLFTNPGYSNNNAQTTYSLPTGNFAALNSGTGSKVEFVANGEDVVDYVVRASVQATASGGAHIGVGEDSSTSPKCAIACPNSVGTFSMVAGRKYSPSEGYHFLEAMGYADGAAGTVTADWNRAGSAADPFGTYLTAQVMA